MNEETIPGPRPWRAWLLRAGGVLWVAVCGWALYGLHREWSGFHFADFDAALSRIGPAHLALGLGFTLASYLCAAALGVMAQRVAGYPTADARGELGRNLVVSAFTMSAGGSVLGGGSIRMRFAAERGVGSAEVGKAMAAAAVAGWGGHVLLSGALLCLAPPPLDWLPASRARLLGGVLLLAGLALPFVGRVLTRHWPRPGLAALMALVSMLDWLFAGLALWALLPAGIGVGLWSTVAVVVVAQALAAFTHVPGGVGVLELALTKALAGALAAPVLAGALVTYRLIYYVAPFGGAIACLALRAAHRRRDGLRRGGRLVWRGWSMVAPRLAGLLALGGGFLLLLSASTPMEAGRRVVVRLFPLPFVEASHFVSSLSGALLIVLAHGLRRRIRTAWWLSVMAMAGGVVFSLVKGFDWEEALVLGFLLVCLFSSRDYFHRRAALWTHRFTAGWWLLIAALLGVATWVGFFTSRHVAYENELWWRFALEGDASRFLRAGTGAACVLLVAALTQALRPGKAHRAGSVDAAAVDRLVETSGHADAALAWLGDKEFVFSEDGRSGLMFADQGGSRIVMGDPLGDTEAADDLLWSFAEQAQDEGMRPVFYQVSVAEMPRLVDMGFKLFKLGEQAGVVLADFTLEGGEGKKLRNARSRFQREGLVFEVWPRERVAAELSVLKEVSDAWLAEHRAGEKGFSLGRFQPDYVRRFPCAVVRDAGGRAVAFANVLASGDRRELSVDMMRHVPAAPNGVMEALFVELLLWGKAQGFERFNLGMAPLSGLSRHPLAPAWHKVAANIFERGGAFYNFQGLRGYKEKFRPEWSPRYIAVPSAWSLAPALLDATVLIGGGFRKTFSRG